MRSAPAQQGVVMAALVESKNQSGESQTMIKRAGLLVLLGIACFAAPVQAAESYDNCTGFIDSLPATISTQGTWCLRKHLYTSVTSGAAISVLTDNVTVDCNHFRLSGLGAGIGTNAVGISAGASRLNATPNRLLRTGSFVSHW